MPYKIADLMALLEEIAPLETQEPWDNSGLTIGNLNAEMTGIYLDLDLRARTVKEAKAKGCNVILTHHPLLFEAIHAVDTSAMPGLLIREALQEGIHVLSAHTNLDRSEVGVNKALADALGLRNAAPLEDEIGWSGEIGPIACGPFAQKVKAALSSNTLRTVGDPDKLASTVMICGGAGGDLTKKASELCVDVLVTSEIKHHQALLAESEGLFVIDAGHYETEYPVLAKLKRLIEKKIEVSVSVAPFRAPFSQ